MYGKDNDDRRPLWSQQLDDERGLRLSPKCFLLLPTLATTNREQGPRAETHLVVIGTFFFHSFFLLLNNNLLLNELSSRPPHERGVCDRQGNGVRGERWQGRKTRLVSSMLLILVFTFSLLNVYLQLEPRRTGTNIITTHQHQHQNERELFFFIFLYFLFSYPTHDYKLCAPGQHQDDHGPRVGWRRCCTSLGPEVFFSFASFLLIRSLNSIGQLRQTTPLARKRGGVGFRSLHNFLFLFFSHFLTNMPQAVAKSGPRDVVDVSCAVGKFFPLVVSLFFLLLNFLLGALYRWEPKPKLVNTETWDSAICHFFILF